MGWAKYPWAGPAGPDPYPSIRSVLTEWILGRGPIPSRAARSNAAVMHRGRCITSGTNDFLVLVVGQADCWLQTPFFADWLMHQKQV